jgi:hypothetical protein
MDFLLGGYAIGAAVRPGWERLRVAFLLFRMGVPDLLVNWGPNHGWEAGVREGMSLTSTVFFEQPDRGPFAGLQLTRLAARFRHEGRETDATRWLIIPHLGAQWFPFGHGLYFMPWLGLALNVAGSNVVLGSDAYRQPTIFPMGATHVGFEL